MEQKKVIARKLFSIEDLDSGLTITVEKGEIGDILTKRPGKPYLVIIKDKTIQIHDRKMLRYLFKIAPSEEKKEKEVIEQ